MRRGINSTTGRRREKGNALFLILIAVALFAALSYAVTQTGRGGGGTSKEQTALEIARIEDYQSQIQTALQRMSLTGTPEYLVDYHDPAFPACETNGRATNTSCTTSSCKLFDPQGGGVMQGFDLKPPSGPPTDGCHEFWNITMKNVGISDQRDLILHLWGFTKDFCIAWNNHVGVANPGGNPPTDNDNNQMLKYEGPISAQVNLTDATVEFNSTDLSGKTSYCFSGIGGYRIALILIAR